MMGQLDSPNRLIRIETLARDPSEYPKLILPDIGCQMEEYLLPF
jgi:hypothetical protein